MRFIIQLVEHLGGECVGKGGGLRDWDRKGIQVFVSTQVGISNNDFSIWRYIRFVSHPCVIQKTYLQNLLGYYFQNP